VATKSASKSTAKPSGVPLLVTTAHKGVFFGYGQPSDAQSIRIERARMIVYWSADVRGIVGLASQGPSKGCRVGHVAPAITLRDVTAVIEVSAEAADKFEAAPWSS
jgi:hypothetical protein